MSHNTEAAGDTQTDRMSYTRRTVLTNGLTNVVVDLPEKEIERLQTDAAYCQQIFDKHATTNEEPANTEETKQTTGGPFEQRRKAAKGQQLFTPWDADMTRFFISEYRNVREMMTKKREAFLHISEKMNQKGYDVTPYTVEKKWHNLIKTYKNVLDRAIRKGEEKISWEFFEDMDEIIRNSTPSLPAPSNLKALANSRKTYPNPIASPAPVPETISVSPDFLPCPPSPELIITTSHSSSSPPANEASNTFNMCTMASSTASPNNMSSSSPSCAVISPHTSLSSADVHGTHSHFLANTTPSHSPYPTQNHMMTSTSWQTQTLHTPTIANVPSYTTQLPAAHVQTDHTNGVTMSHGFTQSIQSSVYSQANEVTVDVKPQLVDIVKTEVKKEPNLRNIDKRKWRLGKAKLYRNRFRRPELDLLASQREMNARLKTLNTNISTVGHTLNENILGLKRAVETMVSIMLQNKAHQ